MYGTVANIRVKAGQEQALIAEMERWSKERAPKVKGVVGGYIFRLDKDPQDMILVAVFQHKETYVANASDPEQDQWFRQFRAHMEADPQWNDGEVFAT